MVRKPPKSASIATAGSGARLFASSAARNCDVIADLIAKVAPASGTALEIASGTGQHVVAFAARCPALQWQPTDVTADRIASIDAYATESKAPNIAPARILDATTSGWAAEMQGIQMVFLANLLHLVSQTEAQTLIAESAKALAKGGTALIYGPFMRGGELTSPGDRAFHQSLVTEDPEIGYKDEGEIITWAAGHGLAHIMTHQMPANNLALEFRKTSG